jgi:hypothetical protein
MTGGNLSRLLVGALAILVLLFSAGHPTVVAKDVKILNLSWMLTNGTTLMSEAVLSCSLLVPIAIKHWNERYDGILPLSKLAGSCSNTLSLVDGEIIDDGNSPNQAMKAILAGDRLTDADIIYGPLLSKVSWLPILWSFRVS